MRTLLAGLALLALAAGAQGRPAPGYANPTAAIAAELAFARMAQEEGQWTAFKATATDDAVMFAPAMVLVQQWLKDRPDPPMPLAWQPHQVWASCDGSLMVTNGAWQGNGGQRSGKHGWFTTVWQRQEDGIYKWVLDHRDETKEPLAAPDMITAHVAECPERRAAARPAGPPAKSRRKPPKREKVRPVPFDPTRREGRSDDGTLTWQVRVDTAGARDFTAQFRVDGVMQEIRSERVAGG